MRLLSLVTMTPTWLYPTCRGIVQGCSAADPIEGTCSETAGD
ncbi:hypothetical protein [Laspinema olomoucense]|nr:hypothetical protein [Laspinema sp. D3d]